MARMNNAMHDLMRYNASLVAKKRSTFNRSCSKATTFDSGYLIPIYIDDILPGDEVKIDIDALVRMTTPIHPVMDSAYLDFAAFFTPDRVVWDNAKAFYGENLDAEYNALGEYQRPTFQYCSSTAEAPFPKWDVGTLLDYMEFPRLGPESSDLVSKPLSVLDFRIYQKIWNDFYRASEVQPSININYGDTVTTDEYKTVFELRKVNKLHDLYTSLLPRPQGGDAVTLPLGDSAPVVVGGDTLEVNLFDSTSDGPDVDNPYKVYTSNVESNYLFLDGNPNFSSSYVKPSNLSVDLTSATSATVNALRTAITVQQALEIDSAGGTRYNSIIASHWGVYSPDEVLQRPQLLGTHREALGMRQVAQTSATTGTQPLGELGAYSATRTHKSAFIDHAFTEYGTLMILCCVRPLHTYSQGYPIRATKLSRFDVYLPVFDNIGNQPVYRDEICAYDDNEISLVDSTSVLGYKEAWMEYRTKQNAVTGLMRPDVDGSLGSIWTYADDYLETPILNSDFLEEDTDLIGRTLAVTGEPQFLADFYFKVIHTRTMGVSSIPGLLRL